MAAASSGGIMPPTTTGTCNPAAFMRATTSSTSGRWLPDNTESPMT